MDSEEVETTNAAQLQLELNSKWQKETSEELLLHLALRGKTALVWGRFE